MSIYFTEYEIDYIGYHCFKLQPEARMYNEDREVDFILFAKHELCVVKEEHQFLVCKYLGEDDAEVLGRPMAEPLSTVQELVFVLLAIVNSKLPSYLINDHYYEKKPITYQ